jgi:hypothetical protein
MAWTLEQKLTALLRLPWTIRVERNTDEGYFVSRVLEIPSAIATADSARELDRETWASLRTSLEVYLENNDAIPLPPGTKQLPWEVKPPATQYFLSALRPGEVWDANVSRSPAASSFIVEGVGK